jgi:hypothetical protein
LPDIENYRLEKIEKSRAFRDSGADQFVLCSVTGVGYNDEAKHC